VPERLCVALGRPGVDGVLGTAGVRRRRRRAPDAAVTGRPRAARMLASGTAVGGGAGRAWSPSGHSTAGLSGRSCGPDALVVLTVRCYRHPVTGLAVLDIVPARHVFLHADAAFGLGYWHWYFLAVGQGIPERLIGAHQEFWIRARMAARQHGGVPADPAVMAEYIRCFSGGSV
jgi:hypothetical protein